LLDIRNTQVAKIFEEIGNLLDIDGANHFRVIAYLNAAETIRGLGYEVREIFLKTPATPVKLPGIGEDLSEKIKEILTTGKCKFHQKLIEKYGHGILDVLEIRSIGPKKAKLFYQKLGIDDVEKLRQAALAGKLRDLPRMGEKSEQDILEALTDFQKNKKRMMLDQAFAEAKSVLDFLRPVKTILKAEYAGSLRRGKETVGDLDLLACPKNIKDAPEIIKAFLKYPRIKTILSEGLTKSSVILDNGIQVDLRVVEKKSYGAALHYFTGSKDHNIAIRDIAKKKGFKVNEYGIFKTVNGQDVYLGGETEEEMYHFFKYPYINPRLRENQGEFEAAVTGKLPKLVELEDLQGDLHVHSNWSDGRASIEDMTKVYLEMGLKYLALTDHSKSVKIVNGLDEKRFELQWQEIDRLNKKYQGKITILKGVECEILAGGQLDLPDSFLSKFDLVIASIHPGISGIGLKIDLTPIVIKALQNPYVKILAHPTGRELDRNYPGHNLKMEKIIAVAAEKGKILEINSNPRRLDLPDNYIRLAKKSGVLLAVNSDSHRITSPARLQYGILTAQRGWVEKKDVINTRPLKDLFKK